MVKTSDYLYLNKEIDFTKPLKMFEPGAERKLRNTQCYIILEEINYVPFQIYSLHI